MVRLREILVSTNNAKLATLWNQGNDEVALNKLSLEDVMKNVATLTGDYQLHRLLEYGISTSINIYATSDKKNSGRNVLYVEPGSLGLPDRDFYFAEAMADKRTAYKKFISTLITGSESLYEFESTLAEHMLTRTELRNPELTYNIIEFKDLNSTYPLLNFEKIFETFGLPKTDVIVLTQPKYFNKLHSLMKTAPDTYKLFLKWHAMLDCIKYCDDASYEIYYEFYLKFLLGQAEKKPKWKRVISVIDANIGELLGKEYVKRHFSERSKMLAIDMIRNIVSELRKRIGLLDWMSAATKMKAYEKLDRLIVKIGYPDVWKDYSGLKLDNERTYFENILECSRWGVGDNLSKCYKPVDKTEWHMTPQTVNAYYNPSMNEIVFPAGILQQPFFSEDYDPGQNFGSFGAIVGHEITHGFDDKGKLYDADGNLNTWWTDKDSEIYETKTKILQDQFDGYDIDGVKINGKLTLGENIADLGGLTISYYAMLEFLKGTDVGEQKKRFFYQWATSWGCNYQLTDLKNRIYTDPHSPAYLRVNGIVRNMIEFYDCFGMKAEHKLYLPEEHRAKIW